MGGAEGSTGGVLEDMVLMFCDARYFIGGGEAEGSTGGVLEDMVLMFCDARYFIRGGGKLRGVWVGGLRRYGSDVL